MVIILVIVILVGYFLFKGNFFQKHFPGSPGDTAKALIREYNLISQKSPHLNREQIFVEILINRFNYNRCIDYSVVFNRPREIIYIMDGDIAALTFLVTIIENKNARWAVAYDSQTGLYGLKTFCVPVMEICRAKSFLSNHSLEELMRICIEIRSITGLY